MKKLSVNIDHIATIRQARKVNYPEVTVLAGICELSGADGITCHLREDRRHIQDRDVFLLSKTLTTKLNLEIAATSEMLDIAIKVKPYMVTLVPENRLELTTEGGLNLEKDYNDLKNYIQAFREHSILTCLFLNPNIHDIQFCKKNKLNSDYLEIHTGPYCDSYGMPENKDQLDRLKSACLAAKNNGFKVNAGHGITYQNISDIALIDEIEEFSIGHGIIAKSLVVGIGQAVNEMKMLINKK